MRFFARQKKYKSESVILFACKCHSLYSLPTFPEYLQSMNSIQSAFASSKVKIETLDHLSGVYCQLWTNFTPCSSVSVVSFEHKIDGWVPSSLETYLGPKIYDKPF